MSRPDARPQPPRLRVRPAGPTHRRFEALRPTRSSFPAQLVIYLDPLHPTVIDGTAEVQPDGSIIVSVPIAGAPPEGTPVQVILYEPTGTVIVEGRAGPATADGSFDILVPTPSAATS